MVEFDTAILNGVLPFSPYLSSGSKYIRNRPITVSNED